MAYTRLTFKEMNELREASMRRSKALLTLCRIVDPFPAPVVEDDLGLLEPPTEDSVSYPGMEALGIVEEMAIGLSEETDKKKAGQTLRRIELNTTLFLEEIQAFISEMTP